MKLRRSACIDTLYLELPFLDRFQAAKEDGFDAVEFWSWADRDLSAVKSASDRAGIPVCGFNGDADLSLIDPAQREAYLAFLHRSLEAARFLGASGVTVHSNGLGLGGVVLAPREDLSHTVKLCSLYAGLAASARLAEEAGVTLYLEPLNISTDHPGNFLRDTQTAAELVGHSPQRIHEWIREEVLVGIKLGSIQYCAKAEFIGFMASPQRLAHPHTEKYKELIREFKYIQRRERENEQRRQKRKMMKEST